MLPIKFQFLWLSSFRREDFLEIDKTETRIAYMAAMFDNGSGRNEQSL